MRLPTDQEIAEAGRALDRDGPLPLTGISLERSWRIERIGPGFFLREPGPICF